MNVSFLSITITYLGVASFQYKEWKESIMPITYGFLLQSTTAEISKSNVFLRSHMPLTAQNQLNIGGLDAPFSVSSSLSDEKLENTFIQ